MGYLIPWYHDTHISLDAQLVIFFAAATIIYRVSKKIKDVPAEYRRLADEVRTLGIAIKEATTATAPASIPSTTQTPGSSNGPTATPGNTSRLQELGKSCHDVLVGLERELDKHGNLGSSGGGSTPVAASNGSNIFRRIVRRPAKSGWQRFRFDADEIRKVREQLTSHLHSFNTLQLNNASQARKTILAWISPVDFTSTHQDIIHRRQEGTGEWFLNSAEYQTWLRSPGETLFCPGIPGAGKTMLTAIAIDHLEAKFRKTTEKVGIAYIYFSYQKEGSQGLLDVLDSLLRQLCAYRHPLPTEIQELYEECTKIRHKGLTRAELVDDLDLVAQSFSQVFILFDALDECKQGSTLLSILTEMFGLQKRRRTVNLLATSRYIPEIMSEFNDRNEGRITPVVEDRASEADVRKYLEGQSNDLLPFARRNKELQGQIVTKIVDALGLIDWCHTFLLAQLHFRSICNHTDKKSVLQALSRLQSGSNAYEVAYEEAMGRIKRQKAGPAELAFKVLAWITCATRPLSTVELQHALAVEEREDSVDEAKITDVDDLVSYCAGLVTVNKQTGIIRLVHYTTQEYFNRERKKWFPSADDDMAAVCLRYISMPVFEQGICASWPEFNLRMVRYPLYSYAAGYWGHHARENWLACKEVLNRGPMNLPCLGEWKRGLADRPYSAIWDTGLHLMTYFGLCGAVEYFVDGCCEGKPDARRTSDHQTLLTWAAKFGREDIARSLISKGADIQARDREGRSPVWWVSCCGYGEIVRLLIEHGAKCHLKDSDGLHPLSIAAKYGFEGAARLLISARADLDVTDWLGRRALWYAAQRGHEEMVEILLASGAKEDNPRNLAKYLPPTPIRLCYVFMSSRNVQVYFHSIKIAASTHPNPV
ncbi:hypothetical protein V8F33_005547 [Rhypophila sp. PSN 637]